MSTEIEDGIDPEALAAFQAAKVERRGGRTPEVTDAMREAGAQAARLTLCRSAQATRARAVVLADQAAAFDSLIDEILAAEELIAEAAETVTDDEAFLAMAGEFLPAQHERVRRLRLDAPNLNRALGEFRAALADVTIGTARDRFAASKLGELTRGFVDGEDVGGVQTVGGAPAPASGLRTRLSALRVDAQELTRRLRIAEERWPTATKPLLPGEKLKIAPTRRAFVSVFGTPWRPPSLHSGSGPRLPVARPGLVAAVDEFLADAVDVQALPADWADR